MNNNKTKMINFRVTPEEYERLMNEKPSWETLSTHIRKVLFHKDEMRRGE